MSSYVVTQNTGQQVTTNYNLEKLFLRDNRYENDNVLNNAGYTSVSFLAGTVLGRVASTRALVPWNASASDGSQYVVGILARDVLNLAAGSNATVSICIAGDVNAQLVVFFDQSNLNTVGAGRTAFDHIQGDTSGIVLRLRNELTGYDN